MVKYQLKIITFLFLLIVVSCNSEKNKFSLPRDLSDIYFQKFTNSETLSYIDYLTSKIESGDSIALLYRGLLYQSLWEESKAMKDYKTYISLDSLNSDAYVCMSSFYSMRLENDSLSKQYIDKALQINSHNAIAYYMRARLQDSPELAIKDYSKAIELSPQTAEYYFWRGSAHDMNHSQTLAKNDFLRAVEIDSNLTLAYSFLGIQAEAENNKQEALRYYNLEIKSSPEESISYERRGQLYYSMGLYNNAIQDYKVALKNLKPTKVYGKEVMLITRESLFFSIAVNYNSLYKIDSMYEYLEQALKLDCEYVNYVQNCNYFSNVKNSERFKKLMNRYKCR